MKTKTTKMRLLFLKSNFRGDFDKKLVRFSTGKGEREERERDQWERESGQKWNEDG